jgi:Tol biopolymer transport system component
MTDRMRPTIWLVDTRTGQHMPLVAGVGAHSQPRWSPDGKRLAYTSTAEGGAAQLFVRWMESGESVRITGLPDTPTSIAWSPEGRQIAYTMFVPGEGLSLGKPPAKPEGAKWAEPLEIHSAVTYRSDSEGYLKPGFSHVFLVSADGGAPRQLSFGNFHDQGPLSWSADGRTIVFSSNRTAEWERQALNSEVYSLDVASGTISALTDRNGPDAEPRVSPDGRLIAYTGFDDRKLGYHNNVLYVMDRNGKNRRALTESLDRSVENPDLVRRRTLDLRRL